MAVWFPGMSSPVRGDKGESVCRFPLEWCIAGPEGFSQVCIILQCNCPWFFVGDEADKSNEASYIQKVEHSVRLMSGKFTTFAKALDIWSKIQAIKQDKLTS
eukprot:5174846-Amphidinium_carterae.1